MATERLSASEEAKLAELARALVDPTATRTIIAPKEAASGFWFGGGNMIEDDDGVLYIVGRYRNAGDSRTGVETGERGLELAIFRSDDRGATFEKVVRFDKASLDVGDRTVLSIEGSALRRTESGVELFVSTEKANIGYPAGFESYLKQGTGVWTIDQLRADTIERLVDAPIRTVLASDNPEVMHYKDPFVYDAGNGALTLLWCTHPYCWSSSNTALAVRCSDGDEFGTADTRFFPRGNTWDVAMTRGTCVVDVPRVGAFADRQVSLMFYDGGECLRDLEQHTAAVKRPRGYSCEEVGGVAYIVNRQRRTITRLSRHEPWFISPHGTGCCRYVDVHASRDAFFVTWQQSQDDLSQPLVMNVVDREQVEKILA